MGALQDRYQVIEEDFESYKKSHKNDAAAKSEASYEIRKKDKIIKDLQEQVASSSKENRQLRSEKSKLEDKVRELVQSTAKLAQLRQPSPCPSGSGALSRNAFNTASRSSLGQAASRNNLVPPAGNRRGG